MMSNALMPYSTAVLSDALDAMAIDGLVSGVKPLNPALRLCGPVFTVAYQPYEQRPKQPQGAADYIDDVPAGSVLLIDNQGRTDCTVWGGLLTEMAIIKQLAGTVVFGAVRDVADIEQRNYPLFCQGVSMRSGKNRVKLRAVQQSIIVNGLTIHPGDTLVADALGVLLLPQQHIGEIMQKAQAIEAAEAAILTAIRQGMPLQQARSLYAYHQPWLNTSAKN